MLADRSDFSDHCFDFIRQAILCHGDVSMAYWWNTSYTTTTSDGKKVHSDSFKGLSLEERAVGAKVHWDVEHKCREIQPIEDWVNQRNGLVRGANPKISDEN